VITITLCKGAPASGKSFWAKQEVAKNPNEIVRINNDDLRAMANGSVWSADYEKIIAETRKFMIKEAIRRNKSVILDNVNAGKRHWEDVCKIAKEANRDIKVYEKVFYEELEVLLERDAKREGKARVGEEVVHKWYKELGAKQFKHYHPRVEIFTKRDYTLDRMVEPMAQDPNNPRAIICDLDGSLAIVGDRSPYSAENCHLVDRPNPHVVETVKLYHGNGYKIIFCSGRMERDREPTVKFIEQHLPDVEYMLLMRPNNDTRKDAIIKEEIFNEHIKDKFFVHMVMDDRISVCRLWYNLGLNLLRVGDPDADF
jgi:predicted kinase